MNQFNRREEDDGTWLDRSLGDGWWFSVRVDDEPGQSHIAELRVRPGKGAGPLTARLLRQISLEGWRGADGSPDRPRSSLRNIGPADSVQARLQRRKRKRGTAKKEELAIVAGAYVQAVNDQHRNASERVAVDLEEEPTWVRDRVHEARLAGLLTPTKRGRQGGELTPEAAELLGRIADDMARTFREMRAMVPTLLSDMRDLNSWLEGKARDEGVNPRVMTRGEFMEWARTRLEQPDSPLA